MANSENLKTPMNPVVVVEDDLKLFVKKDLKPNVTEFNLWGHKMIVKQKNGSENREVELKGRDSFLSRSNCIDCSAVRSFFRERERDEKVRPSKDTLRSGRSEAVLQLRREGPLRKLPRGQAHEEPLCQVCQSQTPWKASGPRLGSTFSVCNTCVQNSSGENQGRREGDETDVDECSVDDSHEELSDNGEDEDADEDEDGGDNQMVPWSWSSMMPLPPSSSSSNREVVSSCLSSKRMRKNTDLDPEENGCSFGWGVN